MFRKLIAPFMVRFYEDDELIGTLEVVQRGYENPKCEVPKEELERVMLVLAKELIRRKIIFWA